MLVEYELVHVKAWNRKLVQAQKSLNSSLLIRKSETQTLHVNFDPIVNEVMREIDVMSQLEIAIPPSASIIRERREELKVKVNQMKVRQLELYSYLLQLTLHIFICSFFWKKINKLETRYP